MTHHQFTLFQHHLRHHTLYSLNHQLRADSFLQHSCPLPSTPEQWSEVDDFTRANITPAVLQERDVNAMQHAIMHGLYTLVSRFNWSHAYKSLTSSPPIQQSVINGLREVNDEKKLAKRELHWLRRSGSSPEEDRFLAEKFHLLVCKSKLVRKANRLTAKASAKQLRRECHKGIHRFVRRVLDECWTSIQLSFNQQQVEEHFSQVYSATPRTFTRPEWMLDCHPLPYPCPLPRSLSVHVRED